MSRVYADAIAELERNRGQLQGQLDRIDLALTSLRELDAPKAEGRASTVPRRPVSAPARQASKPPDDLDAQIVAFVGKQHGVRLSAVAEMLKVDPVPLRYRMKQLVAAGQMTNYGRAHSARYWPAGTTAKEAL